MTDKTIAVGHHLLSAKAVACLLDCKRGGGCAQASKHHPSVIRALARRGLVTTSMTGSYMSGGGYCYWLDLTPDGKIAADCCPAQP